MDTSLLLTYVKAQVETVLKEPHGFIHHPFIDPGSVYDGNVWDWDSYWSAYALLNLPDAFSPEMNARILRHAEGNVLNFFDHQLPDGYIPMMIEVGKWPEPYLNMRHREGVRMNMHKPFLASQALLVSDHKGSAEWMRSHIEGLERYFACYETYFNRNCGLYVWHDDIMIGMDNDPASFGRPQDATANIFLNSFMVTELHAAAELERRLGREAQAASYEAQRSQLMEAIQRECWDPRDQFFYSVDTDIRTRPYDWFHKGLGVFWKTLPIKIRTWSGFLPLYAGIATPAQAAALARHAMDDHTFASPYGICTLAKDEKMFNLSATNNPSNWLGPVWLVANYAVFRGLLNYGYRDEARRLTEGSLRLLERDLRETGSLHEYYHPFTGEPVMNGGFLNWNMLVLNMVRELSQEDEPSGEHRQGGSTP